MKKIYLLLFLLTIFISCRKDKHSSDVAGDLIVQSKEFYASFTIKKDKLMSSDELPSQSVSINGIAVASQGVKIICI